MCKKATDQKERELTLKGVPDKTSEHLKAIASQYGVTVTKFIKDRTKIIVDSFPTHIKSGAECRPCKEIKVRGIGAQTKKELENISEYYGTNYRNLLLQKLIEDIDSFPEHMKILKEK